jgi:hypothetical protein
MMHRFKNLPTIIRFEEWEENPRLELIFNLQARVLELKSWLYRPFVFYAIHGVGEEGLSPELEKFVQKAIECSFHIIQSKPTLHRHHGSWFAARNVLSSALLILAAVKAGELVTYLEDWPELINQAIRTLAHWAPESQDLAHGQRILEKLLECFLEDDDSSP